jgi:hypothetical protein
MLEPYAARVTGYQGHAKFPHSVMGLAFKAPAPAQFATLAATFIRRYQDWLRRQESSLPTSAKIRRRFSQLYRSRGERAQTAAYYRSAFQVDIAPQPMARAG